MSIINYTPYNNIPSEEDDDDSFWLDGIPSNPDFIATSSAEIPANAENPASPPIDYQAQAQEVAQMLDYYEKLWHPPTRNQSYAHIL